MSDSGLEIKVNDSSHPYDDPLWFRKLLNWDTEQKKEAVVRVSEKIKNGTGEKVQFVGVSPKIAYLMIDGDDSENSYLWVHKFSMPTLVAWKNNPSKLDSYLKYNPRHYLDWFEDMQDVDKKVRIKAKDKIVESLKVKNPEVYSAIKSGKYKLIGFTPRIDYVSVGSKTLSNKRCFKIPTLLFWDKSGQRLIIVNMEIADPIMLTNPVLRYDNTILNEINGKKESIRGITG